MADPAKLDRIRKGRAAATTGAPPDPNASKALDSLETQEKILKPKPLVATIAGKPVDVYPLTFKDLRTMRGLYSIIFAEAEGNGPLFQRLSGVLALRRNLLEPFLALAARACFPPDAKPEQLANLDAVAAEIDEKADFAELARLMLIMNDRNASEIPASPK